MYPEKTRMKESEPEPVPPKHDVASFVRSLFRWRRIPYMHILERLLVSLRGEERLLLYVLSLVLLTSVLVLVVGISREASVVVPSRGGNITEGLVGAVRSINPILAVSQTDNDLTELVFSGLTKALPDGTIVPDIAHSYEISPDGTVYTFTLKDNLTFHDGEPLRANDIVFTIQMAQHPDIKSPRRADWEGVAVASPDEKTIIFTLPHPYAPFLENTTLGILPRHAWQDISATEFPFPPLNTHPIGSGAFAIKNQNTDRAGSITEITLTPFKKYALGQPHLKHIWIKIFSNEEALKTAFRTGRIDTFVSTSPPLQEKKRAYISTTLPRVFGIFFNQNHAPSLADPSVRAALESAIDKESIVRDILHGSGVVIESPIPPGVLSGEEKVESINSATEENSTAWIDEAHELLKKGGWSMDTTTGIWAKKKKPLAFTLATSDAPELVATAEHIAQRWQTIGVDVRVQVYTLPELNTAVLRPRSYDALLFGEVIGRTLDLFSFWHSSQRNDPGLNLALYTNSKADALLAEARATTNKKEREALYKSLAEIIKKDRPAIFLYAPKFTYVTPMWLKGVTLGALTTPSERFAEAHSWYVDTERVWNMFVHETYV